MQTGGRVAPRCADLMGQPARVTPACPPRGPPQDAGTRDANQTPAPPPRCTQSRELTALHDKARGRPESGAPRVAPQTV